MQLSQGMNAAFNINKYSKATLCKSNEGIAEITR